MESRRASQPSGDPISEPERAHTVPSLSTQADDSDDEREATELRTPSTRARRVSRIISAGKPSQHWYDPIKKLWRHHIRISVPHVDCRDHLANERTFLGYLRTSVALSMLGVVVAQLYRLQHVAQPDSRFGYFLLSKPIAGMLQCSAIVLILIGATRFYRQQKAMSIGKVYAGGWEVYLVMVFVLLLLVAMFGIHIGIDVYKDVIGTA